MGTNSKWYCYAQQAVNYQTIMHELGTVEAGDISSAIEQCRDMVTARQLMSESDRYSVAFVVRPTPMSKDELSARREIVSGLANVAGRYQSKIRKTLKKDIYIPKRDGIWSEGFTQEEDE